MNSEQKAFTQSGTRMRILSELVKTRGSRDNSHRAPPSL